MADSTVTDIAVRGYKYHGCFADASARVLGDGGKIAPGEMTNQECASECSDYKFFGTENGDQCYCGDKMAFETPASPWHCATHCAGNEEGAENCGGFFYLSVWKLE